MYVDVWFIILSHVKQTLSIDVLQRKLLVTQRVG